MNTEETAMRPAPDPVPAAAPLDRAAAAAEMEQARQDFHRPLHHATAADLCRPTAPRVPLLAGQIRGRRAGRSPAGEDQDRVAGPGGPTARRTACSAWR